MTSSPSAVPASPEGQGFKRCASHASLTQKFFALLFYTKYGRREQAPALRAKKQRILLSDSRSSKVFVLLFSKSERTAERTKVPTVNYLLRHDLHLFQAKNLRRFRQQVSDSDGSVLVARDRGADLRVVRRCANFYVIDGGEWCISA